jgi:protein subunit release factor B
MGINEELDNNNNYSKDIDTNRNITSYALSGGRKIKKTRKNRKRRNTKNNFKKVMKHKKSRKY